MRRNDRTRRVQRERREAGSGRNADAPARTAAAQETINPSGLTSSHDAVNTFHMYGMVRPGTSATCATNSGDAAPQRNIAIKMATVARVAWGTLTRSMNAPLRVAPSAAAAGAAGVENGLDLRHETLCWPQVRLGSAGPTFESS